MDIRIGGPHAAAVTTDAGLDEAAVIAALAERLHGFNFAADVDALCLVPAFGDGELPVGHGPRGVSRKHAIAYVSMRLERGAWSSATGEIKVELLASAARAAVAASGLTQAA
jgi:hypothetical protein